MRMIRKLFPIGITAIVIVSMLAVVASPVSAADLNVPSVDYPTIQEAIDAASDGDTVLVAKTYDASTNGEEFPIRIIMKRGVTLQGEGASVTTIVGVETKSVVNFTDVSNCKIDGFTIKGGKFGIYSKGSSLKITNNTITGNNSDGIYNWDSSPTITNNIITGNNRYGIHNYANSSPTITNNIITDNDSSGIYNWQHSSPEITNNIITGNGRGIDIYGDCSPTITNNIITGNYYGISNSSSYSPTITNNIITGNSYGIYSKGSSPTISYNNVWDNSDANYESSLPDPTGTDGNISDDPMFVDPNIGDYHLQTDSPCIDAGTNDAPGLPVTDFDGNPRIDIVGAVVDMGAFEYVVLNSNSPPVADASPNQTVEATGPNGASVILDGSGSYDPDEDPLTYVWTWGEDGNVEDGVNPTVTLPLGSTIITLTVSDGDLPNEDTVTITVEDTTPPIIEITNPLDGAKVFMDEGIDVEYSVSDICDSDPTVTVSPEDLSPPLPIGELTITVTATDESGNEGSASVTVNVLGPAGIKEEAVSELETIEPSSRRVDRVINKVIDLIDKSLDDRYWVDDLHLDAKRGGKVFMYESLAVGKMKHHIKRWEKRGPTEEQEQVIGVFEAVIIMLVTADKFLAETAMDEANDAEDPWNPRKLRAYNRFLAKADRAFDKALGYIDKERPKRAIRSFKQAWKNAQQAMKMAQ